MDNQEILNNILEIDQDNIFLQYIVRRIQRDDYRGFHISQHNRYDIEKLESILQAIHDVAGEEKIPVPYGDIGKDEKKIGKMRIEYPDFYEVYRILKDKDVFQAPDPIRKNFFVELSRLGFINKYDKQFKLLDPFKKTKTRYVELSQNGIEFLGVQTKFLKYRIFTNALDRLLGDHLVELIEAIDTSEYRRDMFSFEEFTLILSDNTISGQEKIDVLTAYRSLSRHNQERVVQLIRAYCNPKNFSGNKKSKRDYHNWYNETQQLMVLFKMTVYFQVNDGYFSLNTGSEFGIFTDIKRSTSIKEEYFQQHTVDKESDYHLHHIVPISFIKSKEEYDMIDDCQNLIYLHKDKHREIKRDQIVFDYTNATVYFKNRFKDSHFVVAENRQNARFDADLLPDMKSYNKKIRNKVFS